MVALFTCELQDVSTFGFILGDKMEMETRIIYTTHIIWDTKIQLWFQFVFLNSKTGLVFYNIS